MDANGQKFWMVRGDGWVPDEAGTLDQSGERLRLASVTSAQTFSEVAGDATARLERPPMARDEFGGRAFYDPIGKAVFGTSDFPGAVKLVDLVAPASDLALGPEGWLYVVTGGGVLVRDARGRFPSVEVKLAGFDAWRIAPDPAGGAWVLDRTNRKLARIDGQLWPAPPDLAVPPDAFQPVEENPRPLRLTLHANTWLKPGEDPVALACSPGGRLAVLVWFTDPADVTKVEARVVLVDREQLTPGIAAQLRGVARPFSFAWISEERFAVLAAGVGEAPVFTFPSTQGEVSASGEVFPLPGHDGGPFLHGLSLSVEYPASPAPRPLVSVSLPAFPSVGVGLLERPLDSGSRTLAWHRLYVEAVIPPETSFTLHLAATDDGFAPTIASAEWHPHHFGARPSGDPSDPRERRPLAAWLPERSEIPGFDGFLQTERAENRAGLFTVLIQRAVRAVRTLRGRFLHLRIELRGNARATPCVHAIRAYGPRFSYQDKYLPALYREQVFGKEAEAPAEPTPADFLGRYIANFESFLTPLEDRVAAAWHLTDPRSAPDTALGWLGEWIGVTFESWYPIERRRERLRCAPELSRQRGTLGGLRLALDIATGGGVLGDEFGRRRIAVVEDYWMRRTLSTVLGVNLDREFDPLFGGPLFTGNSRVGRTLFLTESIRREVLALFDAAIPLDPTDQAAVDAFFASLAHRATVIVHETVAPGEFQLIERVTTQESPAHAEVRVRRASHDFMIGLAALVGVDTFLRPPRATEPVEVDRSIVGSGALLLRPPSLDPRIEGASSS